MSPQKYSFISPLTSHVSHKECRAQGRQQTAHNRSRIDSDEYYRYGNVRSGPFAPQILRRRTNPKTIVVFVEGLSIVCRTPDHSFLQVWIQTALSIYAGQNQKHFRSAILCENDRNDWAWQYSTLRANEHNSTLKLEPRSHQRIAYHWDCWHSK